MGRGRTCFAVCHCSSIFFVRLLNIEQEMRPSADTKVAVSLSIICDSRHVVFLVPQDKLESS